MSKVDEILEYYKDINVAYNDCTRLDSLRHMLDELVSEVQGDDAHVVHCFECKHWGHLFKDDLFKTRDCPKNKRMTEPCFFCADGVRKE